MPCSDRLWQEWKQTEIDIEPVTDEIERIGTEDERCRRLRHITGFGPLVSTAMVAEIGYGAAFRRGTQFSETALATLCPPARRPE